MTKEDFLFLIGDDPLMQDDAAFVDSFLYKETSGGITLALWDLTLSNVDVVGGLVANIQGGATRDSSGLHISGKLHLADFPISFERNRSYIITVGNSTPSVDTRYITPLIYIPIGDNEVGGLRYNYNTWEFKYPDGVCDLIQSSTSFFLNCTIRIDVDNTGFVRIYKDDELVGEADHIAESGYSPITIGGKNGHSYYPVTITRFEVKSL